MPVIRAKHYGETENALKADPIIEDMAAELRMDIQAGLVLLDELTHPDGHPNMSFMSGSLNEYHIRDGKIQTHIGGPANAILAILREDQGYQK